MHLKSLVLLNHSLHQLGSMGNKLTGGGEIRGAKGKLSKAEVIIDKYCENIGEKQLESVSEFYHAVCKAVENINNELGGTQICLPNMEDLKKSYNESRGKVTKDQFAMIIQNLIPQTHIIGRGTQEILMYIFGVPITSLLFKRGIMPDIVSDDIFIPIVTSATVFVLAKLNKI
ncbi:uncharacterized protein LOC143853486 [Tasmannia lanceolata]|uniref:uncharacterized protein LOC143853486 n=1 Tax=Tasmannia lanceolata TaxID=3420 RepID=UPI004063B456